MTDHDRIAEDLRMLRQLVVKGDRIDEGLEPEHLYLQGSTRHAFKNILDRRENGKQRALTYKQRAWVRGVFERVFNEPVYENLVSAGKVPRGREVATPDVLRHLPLKPPTRRVVE